jgi:protein phosphatase 1L
VFPATQLVWISHYGNQLSFSSLKKSKTVKTPRGSGSGPDDEGQGALYSADLESRAIRLERKRSKTSVSEKTPPALGGGKPKRERDNKDTNRGEVGPGLQIGWAEMTGRRTDQQDTISVIRGFAGDANKGYFGVFDGHGGQTSSEYAAAYLHILLEEALLRKPPLFWVLIL